MKPTAPADARMLASAEPTRSAASAFNSARQSLVRAEAGDDPKATVSEQDAAGKAQWFESATRELLGHRWAVAQRDGYVFSRDGFGELPWIPNTVGHWFRDVAAAAGVDATIESMRHYNATLMLTGGIDLRTAAARLGHGAGVI